jgi:hypothetical protein
VAIEGPLKELGIHDVFQLLDLSKKTGVLRVSSQLRRNNGTIVFDRGAVIAAHVRSNPHPLGGMLLHAGKISEADLERTREMQEGGDTRRLGEILVSIGALSQRELERQVQFQVEEVIFEVIGWREGYFSFSEESVSRAQADAFVRIRTEALLMEGARRIDEWSRIEGHIPHLGIVPSLAPTSNGEQSGLDLLPREWEVLAMIDGRRDLRALAAELSRSEFDVAKTVFGLHSTGVLALHDPGASVLAKEAASDDLEAGVAHVVELLRGKKVDEARIESAALIATHPNEAVVHLTAARVHLVAHRPRDAEEASRRALRFEPLLAPAHRLLGDALALQGQFAEAAEWWERWLTVPPGDATELARRERATAAIAAARTLDEMLGDSDGG